MSFQSGNFDETFLTVAEVAEMLKLNPQTVRNWIDQGRMPALRVGRRVRIRRSDLERVLEESSTTAAAETRDAGPTAEDFWGGEPIGVAEAADGLADAEDVQPEAAQGRGRSGLADGPVTPATRPTPAGGVAQ
jgi:excisionase family DNA binding protein